MKKSHACAGLGLGFGFFIGLEVANLLGKGHLGALLAVFLFCGLLGFLADEIVDAIRSK